MKLNPNKHADVIHAWADGKQIQIRTAEGREWEDVSPYNATFLDLYEYRVKPQEPKSFAEERQAFKQGATIQYRDYTGVWETTHVPIWVEGTEYRIHPKWKEDKYTYMTVRDGYSGTQTENRFLTDTVRFKYVWSKSKNQYELSDAEVL